MKLLDNYLSKLIEKEYDRLKELDSQEKALPNVKKSLTYEQEMFFMEVLQRGDIQEICKAAQSIFKANNSFWAVADASTGIPLKHSGMAETIVKTILNIVSELYSEVDFAQQFLEEKDVWIKINEDQAFQTLLINVIADTLYYGDSTFIINYKDDKINLSYETGRNLEYVYDMDKQLKEIVVLKKFENNDKNYLLKKFIGADALYVKYALYNEKGEEVPLATIEELKDLKDIEITSEGKYVDCSFATQFMINKSTKYVGRGASIFSSKIDALDSLDEVISQRQSVLRSGSPKEFLSQDCIGMDANGDTNIAQTSMHKFFVKQSNAVNNGQSKDIDVLQSDIRAEEYRIYEEDAKRRVLEGILSEQTVSNTSVINNTSITKEREKQTNYTIANIKKAVQEVLPRFVYNVITIYYIYNGSTTELTPNDVVVNFDEYNNPTFENQVDTCAKIKKEKILPNYEMLQELYGNTKTDEEIAVIAKKLDIMDGYDFSTMEVEAKEDDILDNQETRKESQSRNKEDIEDSTEQKSNLDKKENSDED